MIHTTPVSANKLGINIAARHEEFDQAANLVGPGGWVVIMASPGNADELKEILTLHPEVNIILRGHCPSDPLGPNIEENRKFALSWTATLGGLDTAGRKIFFMPWNEPNMTRECGGVGNDFDPNNTACAPYVRQYITDLKNYLSASGLLGNKVELLSPMINQHHANYRAFISALGGRSFFEQFYGISMNLYDNETCGSTPLCHSDIFRNAGKFNETLNTVGLGGLRVFSLETGIIDASGTCPPSVSDCPFFDDSRMNALISAAYPIWNSASNFIMFSPLSYNPETNDSSWIYGGATAEFYNNHKPTTGGAFGGSTPSEFFTWRDSQGLTTCPNSQSTYIFPGGSCGFCAGSRSPNLTLKEEVNDGDFIVHKKSVLTQILEALRIFIKGGTGFKKDNNFVKTPDFGKAQKFANSEVADRLLPFPLKKWIVRSPPNPLVAEHSFPVCNAEEDDQKKVSGKSQSRLDLTAENFSNAIILNDILGKKNQNIKRKNPNNFYNFAVSIEEGKDDDLYRCGQSVVANEINGIDVLADKTPTDWEGNFVENKGVLAAQTSAGTTPTPTPTIFQREATVEVVNQVKTKSAVSSFADIFSSGFIKALLPKNLFSGLSNKDGAVKNRVVTNTGLESTEKDLNVVYPRAAEIEETAKVFREMLLPKAVQ